MSPQRAQSPQAVTRASLSVAHQNQIESNRSAILRTFLRSVPLLLLLASLLEGRRATGDGEVPWDSARFVSRLNAIGVRVRHLRMERVVLNGPTSESKPTAQNAHLDGPLGVHLDMDNCLRGPVSQQQQQQQQQDVQANMKHDDGDGGGAVSPFHPHPTLPYSPSSLVRWRGLRDLLREGRGLSTCLKLNSLTHCHYNETFTRYGEWRLHITVTHENHRVASNHDADMIIV